MTGAQRAYVLLEPPRATRKLRLNPQIPIEQAEALLWVLCARDESTDKARLTTCASRRCLINIQFAGPVQNQWLPTVSISVSRNVCCLVGTISGLIIFSKSCNRIPSGAVMLTYRF